MLVSVSLLNKQQTLKQSSMQIEFHTWPPRGTRSVLLESWWIVSYIYDAYGFVSIQCSPVPLCPVLYILLASCTVILRRWKLCIPGLSCGMMTVAESCAKENCKILEMNYTCMPQLAMHRSTADTLVLCPPILLKNTLTTPMNTIIQYSGTILNDPQYFM